MAKAMRAAAMKAMKVVSKAAKEQAFVAGKARGSAPAAAPGGPAAVASYCLAVNIFRYVLRNTSQNNAKY